MKMWRKLGILVLSLVFVLSFAGFSASALKTQAGKPVIKLKVWAPTEEQSILVTMCNNFAKLHPEATFKFTYGVMGVDKSINALKTDASVAADVFLYPSGGISELTAAGLIMPISYNVDLVKKENAKPAINSCSLNGVLYGVPETANSWFLFYNKSMYTPSDVKSLDAMLAKDLPSDVKNFSMDLGNSWYNAAWFYGAGLNLFGPKGTDDTKCDWNSATGVAVGNYLLDLVNNPKFVNDTNSGLAASLMKQKKLAAMCSGTWSAGDLKAGLGKDYAAAPLPTYTLNGKKCQLSSFVDYKAFGVNAMTKYPQQAEELAEYLGSPNAQLLRFQKINAAPTDTILFNNSQVKANIEDFALSQETALATPMPKSAQLSQYWTPAAALGADIVNGKVTKETMQDELDKFVKALLTKTTN